ncbi:Rne/Rng family ribonuclease [Breoghania sp.]|uniref:Rne/Rng family ribonuclease n=1 Tax=Breoghania sp. TaxID=2065378 RepID=UPI00261F432F|nr:Rne/Rng family ribonuclease [Breoghania sp.]MDJ0930767.1 Rne/Rng family ribonuclease [Breoghania sp.]
MANKMLIDAAHPEETRVVVVRGNRVEEFDFEAANRKQLRGNIYLAKVTRVEPSLQAAFVDYGGNRHGFLAFSEIHPDFYQTSTADCKALLEDEDDAEEETAEAAPARSKRGSRARKKVEAEDAGDEAEDAEAAASDDDTNSADNSDDDGESDDQVESFGVEEVPECQSRPARRHYKIQEVIKRRQVLLVQVVKEERGNKGAALTTCLSLAGRYSVLMPNTARGGGISRKITSVQDRKRLKAIAGELDVPEGMGVILRTAGASRMKAEVKRDFEYLLRLWENVRDLTLRSIAPCLVYEEGSLIKRSIRDLYNKDIDQVLVSGEDGYREAKDFMRMLMPSHAKNVQPYRSTTLIFTRYGIEPQLDAMFSPQVTLKSGGYIVINQTEALVAIDVNSGKSTREHNIEDTATQTNLEAAEEVARQLRLRDLAGLIVIDFIDMEENRNNRVVENLMKDCLKSDRARIQVGRISHFGLLEISRQRIRTGVLESSTEVCLHCRGSGMIRSVESVALHVLRALEDHLLRHSSHHLNVKTQAPVALYILNQKRHHLMELEERFGLNVSITADEDIGTQYYVLERGETVVRDPNAPPAPTIVQLDTISLDDEDEIEESETSADNESGGEVEEARSEENGRSKRRRRRRPSSDDQENRESGDQAEAEGNKAEAEGEDQAAASSDDNSEGGDDRRRKRRRGRRGGRRGRRNREEQATAQENGETAETEQSAETVSESDTGEIPAEVDQSQDTEASKPEEVQSEASAPSEEATDESASQEVADTEEPTSEPVAEEAAAETPAEAETEVAAPETEQAEPAEEPIAADVTLEEAEPVAASESPEPVREAEPVEAEAAEAETSDKDGAIATLEAEPTTATQAGQALEGATGDGKEKPRKRSGWWQRRSFF